MNYSKQRVRRAVRIDFRSSNLEWQWKHDELGQQVRWGLQPAASATEPAPATWAHIEQHIGRIDERRALLQDWRGWLRLARRFFSDFSTSEAIWTTTLHSAGAGQLARYQGMALMMFQWPMFGHSLPMV
jgi:hypothetical protein